MTLVRPRPACEHQGKPGYEKTAVAPVFDHIAGKAPADSRIETKKTTYVRARG
jgi:hypothetical protein